MKTTRRIQARGFTLIELLVVLAIIGILAGLIGEAAHRAIAAAHKVRDTNNVRQLAMVLNTEAMDRNGIFRTGLTREETGTGGTTKDVLQGLLNDGMIEDPAVFAGEGAVKAKSLVLKDENIGFQYVAGLQTTSSSKLPLFFTKGVGLTSENVTEETLAPGTSAWRTEGMVVAYVLGNAVWIGGKEQGGTMRLNEPVAYVKIPASAKIYE
jgi:prepilin-type N-terminal cleavage/methylation domain-containing protein